MYLNFKKFIELIIYRLKNIITSFKSENFSTVETYFENILKFHKTYNQLKLNGITFEIETSKFGDILNELVFIYQQFKDKNFKFDNEKDKENINGFFQRINELIKKFKPYTEFISTKTSKIFIIR
jgi:hypothetical protein